MTAEHKTANDRLRFDLISATGKYFLCPDGVPRKFVSYEMTSYSLSVVCNPVEPDGEPMPYHWPLAIAASQWKLFTRISQQQAQGKTALPTPKVETSADEVNQLSTSKSTPITMSQSQKPAQLANPKISIEKELTAHVGKELTCPDGEVRTLKTFEMGGNGITTLHWGGGKWKEIPTGNFWNEWPTYQLTRNPEAPVAAVEIAKVVMTPQLEQAGQQAKAVIDTTDVVSLLKEQMQKVKNSANAIPQAKTMGDLAKQIIEAEKLKLEAIKVVHGINQK